MTKRSLRGKVAVVGVGETDYYKHGKSPDPEFKMALKAILAAADDAGISAKEIDSFASYADERSDPSRLAAALGTKELRFSNLQWGGGGGGGAAAVGNGAAAIISGLADIVVVYRSLAQGQFRRFGQAAAGGTISGDMALSSPYGVITPAQRFAMKTMRFMHDHGIERSALRAIAQASYHHAQSNPRAVMRGVNLTDELYDNSRWIAEPYKLYDCCMENDGAAALILMSAERAHDMKQKPVYLLSQAQGSDHRSAARGYNMPNYPSANFGPVATHLWDMAELGPKDMDVVQCYENFTGGVLMALIEHGFFTAEEANDFLKLENITVGKGRMPLNTSGGNLAHCYMHGLELQIEAVRQLRGTADSQVANARAAAVVAGPMVSPVSSLVFGLEEML
ncbi:acetyl-CoA acetyltransferase [Hoeflea sp.]|uniref:thiolase C-terminal domain-containing protein n=1 Tax=Hoeflea sp. TaxID=1940281 RepID=UPI0019C0FF1A|nr:acetyl-CoA acetyltransferase [Hoeflea sp.]MBC7285931.1 acetyl-CoA acetyltransferase [Hoeflea sp.]